MEEVYRQSIWAEMDTNRGNIVHDRFSSTKSDSDRQCEAGWGAETSRQDRKARHILAPGGGAAGPQRRGGAEKGKAEERVGGESRRRRHKQRRDE